MGRRVCLGQAYLVQIIVWIASGLLALAMIGAGAMKVVTPRLQLAVKFAWATTWNDRDVALLGLAEVLGAVGLIAPPLTGIAPVLAPIAAACLVVLMLGAVKVHLDRGEPVIAPVILAGLGLFIAVARSAAL